MGSTTGNKIITSGQISPKSKSFIKQTPPKVEILIQTTISKFSKTKNQTQKRPPKSGNSDSKYNFEIFKNQKPKAPKTARRAIGGPKGCWGPKGPPSPLQELEGRARSTLNF